MNNVSIQEIEEEIKTKRQVLQNLTSEINQLQLEKQKLKQFYENKTITDILAKNIGKYCSYLLYNEKIYRKILNVDDNFVELSSITFTFTKSKDSIRGIHLSTNFRDKNEKIDLRKYSFLSASKDSLSFHTSEEMTQIINTYFVKEFEIKVSQNKNE